MSPARKALVCSYHVVQPDRDSGARRIFHSLTFLREAGWEVTFLASDGVGDARDVQRLQQLGVAVYDAEKDSVEELLTRERFDLAVIAFWINAERYLQTLRKLSPNTRVIVDSVDLHFLREARAVFCEPEAGSGARLLNEQFGGQFVGEMNAYASADAVLTVSQKEADLINDVTSDTKLAWPVPDAEDFLPSPVPLEQRDGIVCIGSFQHAPNVQAVEYLCAEILPRVDAKLLTEHPVYIIGNALDEKICALADGLANVKMVGWVPDVVPYLERARISIVPLLYGAGTKRKLMQALAIGTPTVSTTIGVEGFHLRDREHVLIADEPGKFAAAIEELLRDGKLWQKLAAAGRKHMAQAHGFAVAREKFYQVITTVFKRRPKTVQVPYAELVPQIIRTVTEQTRSGATVALVSKGDDALLALADRRALHFPQTDDGTYAGNYPADSAEAIAQLDRLRARGTEYLIFPKPAYWWLDHYKQLREHLEQRHQLVSRDEVCAIFHLRPLSKVAAQKISVAARPLLTRKGIFKSIVKPDDVKLIAFYLPQFHPIPENDKWWGEGFTEWTNVARGTPQFEGHYQPHVPADLGFYDLRLAETREQQAALARKYGIHGFCYYHYWFNGTRLLEHPFNEVLASGTPDFPFCLCWANDPWSRRWDGRESDLLQAQTYSEEDDVNHIRALLPALQDPRAITVDGKPLFLVYRAKHLPDPARTTDSWRKEVRKAGLKGLHLVAVETAWDVGWDATKVGFDAKVLFQPQFGVLMTHAAKNGSKIVMSDKDALQVYDYASARVEVAKALKPVPYRRYESVFPGWDNTARVGERAVVMHGSTPAAYEAWLRETVERARSNPPDERLVFLNAWNEWAEGAHLEPDVRHGHAYLEATAAALKPKT